MEQCIKLYYTITVKYWLTVQQMQD